MPMSSSAALVWSHKLDIGMSSYVRHFDRSPTVFTAMTR